MNKNLRVYLSAICLTLTSAQALACRCGSEGERQRHLRTATERVRGVLESDQRRDPAAGIRCDAGQPRNMVSIHRCADVAPGLPEDQCLERHRFTQTYGKPREACEAEGGSLPLFEVVELNPGYFVIRQNKCSNVEAPFMYLTMGETGAFLHDTGAYDDSGVGDAGVELRRLVEELIARRSAETGRQIHLTVGHGHAHGDHTSGDDAFSNPASPNITVVGTSPAAVSRAYGMDPARWPNQVGTLDLGGRRLSVIPIPGHESSSVAFYDQSTGDVLTGDSLYPGNVFVNGNWSQHRASTARLSDFLNNLPAGSPPVRMVLGSHVEISQSTETTPGENLGWGNPNQPNEHTIVLRKAQIDQMNAFLQANPTPPGEDQAFNDFIVAP